MLFYFSSVNKQAGIYVWQVHSETTTSYITSCFLKWITSNSRILTACRDFITL